MERPFFDLPFQKFLCLHARIEHCVRYNILREIDAELSRALQLLILAKTA